MAEPASDKQLALLKKLTGKDFSDIDLTTAEASSRIKSEMDKKDKPKESKEPKTNGDMTNEMWAEKDKITRVSIERQVAAKIAFEHTEFEVAKTLEIAEQIYQWISGQKPSPKAPESPMKPTKHEKGSEVSRDLDAIKSLPEFHKAISDDFGIQPPISLKILDKETWPQVTDSFKDCYLTIMRSRADND